MNSRNQLKFNKLCFFAILLWSTQVLAQETDVKSDPICGGYNKEWNLENESKKDLLTFKKHIEKTKGVIQGEVLNQVNLWREIYKRDPVCFTGWTGMGFNGNNIFIYNYERAKNFRFADDIPQQCLKGTYRQEVTKTYVEIRKRNYEEYVRKEAEKQQEARDGMGEIAEIQVDNTRVDNQSQDPKWLQLDQATTQVQVEQNEIIEGLNKLKDVGLKNYCINHLPGFYLKKRLDATLRQFNHCQKLFDNNKIFTEKPGEVNADCKRFPKELEGDMALIQKEVEALKKSHPNTNINTMTKFDQDIFGKLNGDIEKLAEARKKAVQTMDNLFKYENFVEKADLNKPCAGIEKNNLFQNGLDCENNTYSSVIDFNRTTINENISVVKSYFRDQLIKELNGQAFAKNIEARVYLLGPQGNQAERDLLRDISFNKVDYRKACLTLTENANSLCEDEAYFKKFKEGFDKAKKVKDNWLNQPQTHPLDDEAQNIAGRMNNAFTKLRKICEDSSLKPEDKNYMLAESWAGLQFYSIYFYKDEVKERSGISKWFKQDGSFSCPEPLEEAPRDNYYVDWIGISRLQKEFYEVNKKQIKNIANFSHPNRGEPSNIVGQVECWKGKKEKNDLYAIESLFKTYPNLAGQFISAIDKLKSHDGKTSPEKQIYQSLICEAEECSDNVKRINDYAMTGAQTALLIASFVPVPGWQQAAIGALAVSAKICEDYKKTCRAEENLEKMQAQVLTNENGGFTFDAAIEEEMDKLKEQADKDKFRQRVAVEIASEVVSQLTGQIMGEVIHQDQLAKEILDVMSKPANKGKKMIGQTLEQLFDRIQFQNKEQKKLVRIAVNNAVIHFVKEGAKKGVNKVMDWTMSDEFKRKTKLSFSIITADPKGIYENLPPTP